MGRQINLVEADVYERFQIKRKLVEAGKESLRADAVETIIRHTNPLEIRWNWRNRSTDFIGGIAQASRNPLWSKLKQLAPHSQPLPEAVEEQVEIQIKYEGYIDRQTTQIQQFKKMEHFRIPDDFDYASVRSLKTEACEQLAKIRPISVGQASRIPGVSPADISILMVWVEQHKRQM